MKHEIILLVVINIKLLVLLSELLDDQGGMYTKNHNDF